MATTLLTSDKLASFNGYLKGVFAGRSVAGCNLTVELIDEIARDIITIRVKAVNKLTNKVYFGDAALSGSAIASLPAPIEHSFDRLINQVAHQEVARMSERLENLKANGWVEEEFERTEIIHTPDMEWLDLRVDELVEAGKF